MAHARHVRIHQYPDDLLIRAQEELLGHPDPPGLARQVFKFVVYH